MKRLIADTADAWKVVRPELTQGVEGKTLLDGATKIVLTRVAPGGLFRPHRDTYGHLFQILSGRIRVQVEQDTYEVGPGEGLRVAPGELHGYENCSAEALLMIAVNLPA